MIRRRSERSGLKARIQSDGNRRTLIRVNGGETFKTLALTEVNAHILDTARDSIAEEQEWEFFCECGELACHEHVELTIEAYIALQGRGDPVLAPGHHLSHAQRARRVRQAAQAVREESLALRAQAGQQTQRAAKNRGKTPSD
jgi:hypothetical protein